MHDVKHSIREPRIPAGVVAAWKPKGRPAAVLLRWFATHWCNYRCPYCRQNHARRQPIDGHWAHFFDNWPVDQWLRAFQRHFQARRLSLVITGGEPLVDHAPMAELVNGLTAMPTVECIRIDTNASLAMEKFQAFDPRKITLMCTFHPSQSTEQRFFQKIDALLSRGFKIGMVNYVLTSETLPDFERRYRSLAQRGVPLHPNPLWGSRGAYSREGLRILQEYLPRFDYGYRTGLRSPLRQACFFPAVAYQMNPWGRLHVGCHRTRTGSFFEDELPPQFAGPVPCPQTSCVRAHRPASLKLRIAAESSRIPENSAGRDQGRHARQRPEFSGIRLPKTPVRRPGATLAAMRCSNWRRGGRERRKPSRSWARSVPNVLPSGTGPLGRWNRDGFCTACLFERSY